jgi:hypothetical protein
MTFGADLSATLARGYLAATLGLSIEALEVWDCQGRQGVCGLRHEHRNRLVAVGAKLVIDEDLERMVRRINRVRYTPDPRLGRRWTVVLRHGADVRRAVRRSA